MDIRKVGKGPRIWSIGLIFGLFVGAAIPVTGAEYGESFSGPSCQKSLLAGPKQGELRIATFNTRNLMGEQSIGAAAAKKFRDIGQTILQSSAHILCLQEVGMSQDEFNWFLRRHLNNEFDGYLAPSPDKRGIKVAFLIKKTFKLSGEIHSHLEQKWIDPHSGEEVIIMARGFPRLDLFDANGVKRLALYGTHMKSKRSRNGDPQSEKFRAAQIENMVSIIESEQKGESAPYMILGDFNGAVNEESTFLELYEKLHLVDALDSSREKVKKEDRVTFVFFPRVKKNHNVVRKPMQLDAQLLSPALKVHVNKAQVFRFDGSSGMSGLPQTYHEKTRALSDHYPVLVDYDWQGILGLTDKFQYKLAR